MERIVSAIRTALPPAALPLYLRRTLCFAVNAPNYFVEEAPPPTRPVAPKGGLRDDLVWHTGKVKLFRK